MSPRFVAFEDENDEMLSSTMHTHACSVGNKRDVILITVKSTVLIWFLRLQHTRMTFTWNRCRTTLTPQKSLFRHFKMIRSKAKRFDSAAIRRLAKILHFFFYEFNVFALVTPFFFPFQFQVIWIIERRSHQWNWNRSTATSKCFYVFLWMCNRANVMCVRLVKKRRKWNEKEKKNVKKKRSRSKWSAFVVCANCWFGATTRRKEFCLFFFSADAIDFRPFFHSRLVHRLHRTINNGVTTATEGKSKQCFSSKTMDDIKTSNKTEFCDSQIKRSKTESHVNTFYDSMKVIESEKRDDKKKIFRSFVKAKENSIEFLWFNCVFDGAKQFSFNLNNLWPCHDKVVDTKWSPFLFIFVLPIRCSLRNGSEISSWKFLFALRRFASFNNLRQTNARHMKNVVTTTANAMHLTFSVIRSNVVNGTVDVNAQFFTRKRSNFRWSEEWKCRRSTAAAVWVRKTKGFCHSTCVRQGEKPHRIRAMRHLRQSSNASSQRQDTIRRQRLIKLSSATRTNVVVVCVRKSFER